jgi:hypothetical protein
MSPSFAVFILMNNYFHDVATSMLLATAIAMRLVLERFGQELDGATLGYVRSLTKNTIRLLWFSVAWIIFSAVPRALTFRSFEWANAVQLHHESGLIAKYVIAAAMMIAGTWLWAGLLRDLRLRGLLNND